MIGYLLALALSQAPDGGAVLPAMHELPPSSVVFAGCPVSSDLPIHMDGGWFLTDKRAQMDACHLLNATVALDTGTATKTETITIERTPWIAVAVAAGLAIIAGVLGGYQWRRLEDARK